MRFHKHWRLEDIDVAGYRNADNTAFPLGEHEQHNTILIWKQTGPWDFSRDNAGWSNEDRATEFCIEANLVDPCVAWELKNIYLL